MKRIVLPATVAAITVALAACVEESEPSPPEAPVEPEPPEASAPVGSWTLTHLGDAAPPENVKVPTLTIADDGAVSGFSGVNRFTGRLNSGGEALFGPLASTRMAGPPEAMKLESQVLKALHAADQWEVDGDALTLTAPGQPRLVFQRD